MDPLYSYYIARIHELSASVAGTNAVTRDGIHRLRVTLKKLKAVFKLLGYLDPDFDSKFHIGQMKPLFAASGKVRDLDIVISLLGKTASTKILDELHTFERQKVHVFVESLKDVNFDTLLPTDEIASICASSRNEFKYVRIFLSLSAQEMSKDFSDSCKKKQLHDLRKRLKEFLYLAEIVHDSQAKEKSLSQLLSEIEMIQRELGRWHDVLISIDKIKKLSGGKQADRKELIRFLKKCEKKKRAAVLERISSSEIFSHLSHL